MIQRTPPSPVELDPLLDVEHAQDLLEGVLARASDVAQLPELARHELVVAIRHVARAMAIAEAVAEGTLLIPPVPFVAPPPSRGAGAP